MCFFNNSSFTVLFCSWNEWLTLPVKYSELSRNAQLALTVWDIYGTHKVVPVGGTTVSLFGKHGLVQCNILYGIK